MTGAVFSTFDPSDSLHPFVKKRSNWLFLGDFNDAQRGESVQEIGAAAGGTGLGGLESLHVVCGILEIRNDGPAARLEDPENLPASLVAALTAADIVNA